MTDPILDFLGILGFLAFYELLLKPAVAMLFVWLIA